MIKRRVETYLKKHLNQKMQNVVKLRWEKEQLKKMLQQMRKNMKTE